MVESKRVYSVPETSELLGISRNSLYLAMRRGELKSFKIGGRRLFRGSSIEAFLDQKEREAAA